MKVLVTGSSGLVGRAIQDVVKNESLKFNDYSFIFATSKDADLRNIIECENLFKKHKPEYVIHLAAFVGGLFKNMQFPVEFWTENVSMNNNVLCMSHKYNVKKVISCLSTCIFPDKTTYPINEKMIHNGPPHFSNEPYAYAKRMVDVLNRAYNREYKCKFTSVIPTNIYGPNDNFNMENSHVIPGLIHKCFLAKKNSTDLEVSGTGKPLRQFIFSFDLAKLILKILKNYNEIEPIILADDEKNEISIKNVVDLIVKNLKFNGKINWDKTKSDGQYKKTASNAKLRKIFPQFKFTPIDEGISKTCKWFEENYENARK